MIKKLFIALIIMVIAKNVGAYTSCVGGTPITRNQYNASEAPSTCTVTMCPDNAKTFCKSIKTMNWWSAFNWCKANGGTLASFNSMCPGAETVHNNVEGACPALQKTGEVSQWVWSSLGRGTSDAFVVNLSTGAVFGTEARFRDYRYALCE